VIPMRIFGAYEALPRGGKRLRFHPITVVVGRKMEFSDEDLKGDPRVVYQQISDRVMDAIKKLELPTDRN
jgi:1-acyl-sn-glycerol-3-phosphate acyltransferase